MLVFGCAVLVSAGCSSANSGGNPTQRTGDEKCAESALLPPDNRFPGFVKFYSVNNHLPFHGRHDDPPLYVRRFQCGVFRGYMTHQALVDPYRASEDRITRTLGEPIVRWPDVPLKGLLLKRYPHGVFEIYIGIYRFADQSSAKQFENGQQQTAHTDPTIRVIEPAAVDPSLTAALQRSGSGGAAFVEGTAGRVAVVFRVQGGPQIAWSDASSYWNIVHPYLRQALK